MTSKTRQTARAAATRAMGAVGPLFLVSGFVLQLLPHFDIGWTGTVRDREIAVAVTLFGGTLPAWLMYRVYLGV